MNNEREDLIFDIEERYWPENKKAKKLYLQAIKKCVKKWFKAPIEILREFAKLCEENEDKETAKWDALHR